MKGVRAALVAGAVVLLAAVAAVLARSEPRLAGSDAVLPQAYVITLEPGQESCQKDAVVPADTARLRMTVASFRRPEPALRVSLQQDGKVIGRGGRGPDWEEGPVIVPLTEWVGERRAPVRICVRNAGPVPMAVAGEPAAPEGRRLSFEFLRAGEESWFATAPRVARHFGLGKADLLGGGWTFWATIALVLSGWAAAARALLRPEDAS